jgi:hypothetical protein
MLGFYKALNVLALTLDGQQKSSNEALGSRQNLRKLNLTTEFITTTATAFFKNEFRLRKVELNDRDL